MRESCTSGSVRGARGNSRPYRDLRRREFITLLGGAAAWPFAARGQQPALPVVGFVHASSSEGVAAETAAFRRGLNETGYVDGQNVVTDYRWLEGRYDRLPSLLAELAARRVAVIVTTNSPAALAAKAAIASIPVVFGVGDDPVKLGLVASLNRPGGNMTGVNLLVTELVAKRLGLMRELLPKAARVGFIGNPPNSQTEVALGELDRAARAIGWSVHVANASTVGEIDAAFETVGREHVDALFVTPDQFFNSRRVQFATLAARHALPASYSNRSYPEVGGLMSYGPNLQDIFRQMGNYTGRILKGEKPANLPVVQSTKLEFVINLSTARILRLEIPPTVRALADEAIE
jgi:putative ABC transport system substrate-binding protein